MVIRMDGNRGSAKASGSGAFVQIIPGPDAETEIRIVVEPGPDGDCRLEQLAYNRNIGWYVQRSFRLPQALVRDVATALRIVDCLHSQRGRTRPPPSPRLRLVPLPDAEQTAG